MEQKEEIVDFIALVSGEFDRVYGSDGKSHDYVQGQKIPASQYLVALKLGYLTKSRMGHDPKGFKDDVLKTIQDAYKVLKTYSGEEIYHNVAIDERDTIRHGIALEEREKVAESVIKMEEDLKAECQKRWEEQREGFIQFMKENLQTCYNHEVLSVEKDCPDCSEALLINVVIENMIRSYEESK